MSTTTGNSDSLKNKKYLRQASKKVSICTGKSVSDLADGEFKFTRQLRHAVCKALLRSNAKAAALL